MAAIASPVPEKALLASVTPSDQVKSLGKYKMADPFSVKILDCRIPIPVLSVHKFNPLYGARFPDLPSMIQIEKSFGSGNDSIVVGRRAPTVRAPQPGKRPVTLPTNFPALAPNISKKSPETLVVQCGVQFETRLTHPS